MNTRKLVYRVRTLVYIGDEVWVRTCTESPNNYVTDSVEFKDKNGQVVKKIQSQLGDIIETTWESLP